MTVVDTRMSTAELFDQLAPGLDAQTLNVIERHRSGGLVGGRGWLVRRALALSDMIGLSAAFVVAMLWWGGAPVDDRVADIFEVAVFLLSLPAWILAANLYGLYSSAAGPSVARRSARPASARSAASPASRRRPAGQTRRASRAAPWGSACARPPRGLRRAPRAASSPAARSLPGRTSRPRRSAAPGRGAGSGSRPAPAARAARRPPG